MLTIKCSEEDVLCWRLQKTHNLQDEQMVQAFAFEFKFSVINSPY